MRRIFPLVVFLLLLALPAWALGQTRALLVACRDFLSLPDLGNSVSGNLHIVGSALVGAGLNLGSLSIEDGPIGPVRRCNPPWTTHSATRTRPISPSSTCAPTACSPPRTTGRFI